MRDADRLLARKRFKAAWKVGVKLAELRYSGAFEIRAKAFEGLGRPAAALAILARGVRRAPDSSTLLSLLGAALSDAGRYDEALLAFETGRRLEGNVDLAIFRGNQALALVRAGRVAEAEALLDAAPADEPGTEDPGYAAFLSGVKADIEAARRLPSAD
jgi:Flp pilus assembly protein TadD